MKLPGEDVVMREIALVENAIYHLIRACLTGDLEDFLFSLKQVFELEQFKDERVKNSILEALLIYAKRKGYSVDDILILEDRVGVSIPANIIAKIYGAKNFLKQ